MQVMINRQTNKVVGLNRHSTPLYLTINVDDSFTLTKVIEDIVGYTEQQEGQKAEPIVEKVNVTLETRPEVFTLEEVVEAKYKAVLNTSMCDYIIADIFIDENDLDLKDPKHKANTGMGVLQLLPNGQAKTKVIKLATTATNFTLLEFDADQGVEIYLVEKLFSSGKVEVTAPVNSCVVKFINTTDKPKTVRAYAVGY